MMAADFTRDRWGRPLIVPADGGKPVAYGRFSSHGSVLEDKFALEKWKIRTSAYGLTKREDLFAQLAACPPTDTKRLDEIMSQALEAGGGSVGANLGTALHEFTQRLDTGEISIEDIAEPWRTDMQAYVDTMKANNLTVIPELVEVNLVNDLLELAGTADRFYRHPELGVVCADIKTGKQISKNPLAYAVQLASYAHSMLYDIETGERKRIHEDLILHVGYIIHIPANQGRCEIYEVNMLDAMEAARLARTVKQWQKRSDLVRPLNPEPKTPRKATKASQKAPESSVTPANSIRYDWVRRRLQPVMDIAKTDLQALWPDGVRTPSKATIWADLEIDRIVEVLAGLEAIHGLPFGEPDPTAPTLKLSTFSFEKPTFDEGGIEDDLIIIGVKNRLDFLQPANLQFVKTILDDAKRNRTPISLKQKTVRQTRILDAVISLSYLASGDDADLQLIRTIVESIRSPLPDLPVGHIVGTFTIQEAERLEQLAQRIHAGETVIHIEDDGSITFKEAK
jgi:hypothetical protein